MSKNVRTLSARQDEIRAAMQASRSTDEEFFGDWGTYPEQLELFPIPNEDDPFTPPDRNGVSHLRRPMTAWREVRPAEFMDGETLSEVTTALAHAVGEKNADAARQLLAGETETLLEAVRKFLREYRNPPKDIWFSLHLTAAMHGDVVSALELVRGLMQFNRLTDKDKSRRIRIALEWLQRFGHTHDYDELREQLSNALNPPPPSPPAKALNRDGSQRIVLDQISDGIGKEGLLYKQRYGRLLEPLKFHGGKVAIEHVETVLNLRFPWLPSLTAKIISDLKLRRIAGVAYAQISPIILFGPTGSGKTTFARLLASLLQCGVGYIDASGSSDARSVVGTSRAWSSAQPNKILLTMLDSLSANPMMIVDELDKEAQDSRNGRISDALLPFLERRSATKQIDECLLGHADVSAVSWIICVNDLDKVSAPIRNRCTTIECPLPAAEHIPALAESILTDLAREFSLPPGSLRMPEVETIDVLIRRYRKGKSLRSIRKALERMLPFLVQRPTLH